MASPELLRHLAGQIQHIDDHGGNRHDPLVGCAGEPSGPAALRTARENKAVDAEGRVGMVAAEILERVHGADGALDHGKQEGPRGVAGLEVAVEGVGDDLVLGAHAVFVGEPYGFVGHALENRDNGTGGHGHGDDL